MENRPIKITDRHDRESDRLFWQSKTPEERLDAVEFLREQCYAIMGFKETPPLIRKITIVKRSK